MISFYDVLILVGRPDHQPYADRLNQELERYGFDVWQLATLPSSDDANTIDRVVSHAHNVLIVATPDGYPNELRAVIEQAVAYHKRLFLIHPLDLEDGDASFLSPTHDHGAVVPGHPRAPSGSDRWDHQGDGGNPAHPETWANLAQASLQAWQALASIVGWDGRDTMQPWLIQAAVQVEGDPPSPSWLALVDHLRDQAEIIDGHSRLLVQALHWASQSYADAALLSEADLVQTNQWLNALAQHPGPTCQLTALQRDLLLASTQRTDAAIVTVLLAYADGDRDGPSCPDGSTTVEALRDLIQAEGISLWDPYYDCPPESNLKIALSRATEACDNYVILLSPHALGHALCLEGLLFALSMNKRIVPVLLSTVDAHHLPEPLQGMPWVDLRGVKPPLGATPAGQQLLRTLRHEADYHRTHTQLLMAALRWERQQRHPSGLLFPQEAQDYQRWIQSAQTRTHHRPIYLQTLLVAESLRQGSPSSPSSPRPRLHQLTTQLKTWLSQHRDR